ncbi:MAG TPA: DUF554 domain-containing protein [Anaerolineales bacterium]|nr:DUF554 domain-containing protein [Anaerolineales bacterium]
MTGTIINIITVLVGGSLGLFLGTKVPERIRDTVMAGLGLFVLGFGLYNFLETNNPLIVLGSLLVGALLGEWWKIEEKLQSLGSYLESRFTLKNDGTNMFVHGFLAASILFCVGPMAIIGSIQDGLTGDFNILATKAIMDGFAALAFASTLGSGVLFSVVVILVYQGGLSLLANQLNQVITTPMMAEMNAAGGILLIGIAISSLLEIKKIRVGNFLPALFIAPLIVYILGFL